MSFISRRNRGLGKRTLALLLVVVMVSMVATPMISAGGSMDEEKPLPDGRLSRPPGAYSERDKDITDERDFAALTPPVEPESAPELSMPKAIIPLFFDNFTSDLGWTYDTNWERGAATASFGEDYGFPDPGFDHTGNGDDMLAGALIGDNVGAPEGLHDYYYLTSPPIDCSGIPTVSLELWRWLNSDYTPFMKNVLEVYDGGTWNRIWETFSDPGVQDNTWTLMQYDISAYAAGIPNVQIRMGYNVDNMGVYAVSGWNLDDVLVYYQDYGVDLTPDYQADFGFPTWDVDYTINIDNTGMTDDTYDLGYVNTILPWPVTFRDIGDTVNITTIFVAAGNTDQFIARVAINASANPGNFDIADITATSQGDVSVSDTAQVQTQVPLNANWSDDFESGWGAWTTEAWSPSPTNWEIGNPVGWGPGTALSGSGCAGTNVADWYYPNADILLVSPYVELGAGSQIFNFYTWYDMDTGDDDGGFIELSVNGGGWSQIWPTPGYPSTGGWMGGYSTDGFSGISSGWEFYEFDLSGWAGQVVQARFHFAATDWWGMQDGWYVDDIYMGDLPSYRADLYPDFQQSYGVAGTDVDYTISIDNTGAGNDTYDLSYVNTILPWPVTFRDIGDTVDITTIFVAAGNTGQFIARVTSNASANPGNFDIANVTATSQGNTSVSDMAQVMTGVPFASPWLDDFEFGVFGGSTGLNWSASGTASYGVGTHTSQSEVYSMYTSGGPIIVSSWAVDASSLPSVILECWIREGDDAFSENPDGGENLEVYYRNNAGNWILLETFFGGGVPGEIYIRSYNLSADALHQGLQVGFSQLNGGAGGDYWHIDDVYIGAPPHVVSTDPVDGATEISIASGTYVIQFSRPMNVSAGTIVETLPGAAWPTSWTWSADGMWLNGTYNALAFETIYWVNLSGFRDIDGNALTDPDHSFNFTTMSWATVTGPTSPPSSKDTNPTITYNHGDSPVNVTLWYWRGGAGGGPWVNWGTDTTVNGTWTPGVSLPVSDTYYWYAQSNGEPAPAVFGDAEAGPYVLDITAPTIATSLPADSAAGVSISQAVIITFNETIDTTTFLFTCVPDPGGWGAVWSTTTFANDTVILSHNNFTWLTLYVFNVTRANDTSGNPLAAGPVPNPWTFTTIDEPPYIVTTTPIDGAMGVLLGQSVVIRFNESMNTSTFTYTCTPDPGGWSAAWSTTAVVNDTVTLSHTNFTEKTFYTFNVTTADDLLGNPFVPGPVSNPWTFMTGDFTSPEIQTTTPVDVAINVPVGQVIVIRFNESIDIATFTYTCLPDPGGWSWVWSQSAHANDTVTGTHISFAGSTLYTFTVTAANDTYGNGLAAGPVPNPWNFTTEVDLTSPQVTENSPTGIGVGIGVNVVIRFNESMNITATSGAFSIDPSIAGALLWNPAFTTLTFTPGSGLQEETTYTVTMNGSIAKDTQDHLLDGDKDGTAEGWQEDNHVWSFTTGDFTSPGILTTTPADTATGEALDQAIVIQFNESMDAASFTYTSTPDPGGWGVAWSTTVFANDTVTLSHTNFTESTLHTFTVTQAEDTSGNPLAWGSVPNPWTFTTLNEPPYIAAITPSNGAVDVMASQQIVIRFNESMDTAAFLFTCVPDPGGWGVAWSTTLFTDDTVTLSHTNFTESTLHTFTVTQADDAFGNPLVAGPVPNPWTFTTRDEPPYIVATTPSDGAVDVTAAQQIVIQFNESMDTAAFTYTCVPDPGGWGVVWGTTVFVNDTVTLTHNDFGSFWTYIFTVTQADDAFGNALVAGLVLNPWSFTTGDFWSPVISTTTPVDGGIDITANQVVVIQFNESIDTSTFTYTCVPDPGGWGIVWSQTIYVNDTVTLTHNSFGSFWVYTFTVTQADDVSGNSLAAGPVPNPWSFTAGDFWSPVISTTTPVDGGIDITANQAFVIRFNESMDTSTFTYTCVPDPGGWGVVWSQTIYVNDTVTLTHNNFGSFYTYTFTVTQANDMGGNALVAGPVPNPWSFTAGDFWSPVINTTTPGGGAINVPVNQNVIIQFNESMNITSVENNFTLTPSVPGIFSWSPGNITLTFNPTSSLQETRTYSVRINGSGAMDVNGNLLDGNGNGTAEGWYIDSYAWTFTTRDETRPTSSVTTSFGSGYYTSIPITVGYTASDSGGSGLLDVELWYRLNGGFWVLFGTNPASGGLATGSFSFDAPNGDGTYELFTIAEDNSHNNEVGSGPDASLNVDMTEPTSAASALPVYTGSRTFDIAFTSDDSSGSGVFQVILWYRTDTSSWQAWPTPLATGPFSFTAPSDGTYHFYTQAEDASGLLEPTPAPSTTPDAFTTVDTEKPSSHATELPPYTNEQSITVHYAAAMDSTSGVKQVQLWYRKDGGTWTKGGTKTSSPAGSFIFSIALGDGTYEFYTVAVDEAGNFEDAPVGGNDTYIFVDTGKPESSASGTPVDTNSATWDVPYTASDGSGNVSGVVRVELWYRKSGGTWAEYANRTSSSGTFSFTVTEGDGIYEFHTIARDDAGNYELAPLVADATTRLDTVRPSSQASVSSIASTSRTISVAYASDDYDASGIENVELWFRKDGGTWTLNQTATPDSGTFTFIADSDGTYEFYTRATDCAGNRETAPSLADASVEVDSVRPIVSTHAPSGTDVDITENVEMDFSEVPDRASVEDALTMINDAGDTISGIFSWSGSNQTLTFDPQNDLEYETTYNVSLGTGARDMVGNHLAVEYYWLFTTGQDSDLLDTDQDGILNYLDDDKDGDGIADSDDDLPLDTDNDGILNAQDDDWDGDGVPNTDDSEPFDTDNDGERNDVDIDDDGDGMPDTWENDNDLNPVDATDASQDMDGDGLSNLKEFEKKTDPKNDDSDGDGVNDGTDSFPLDNARSSPEGFPWWIILLILIVVGALVALMFLKSRGKPAAAMPPETVPPEATLPETISPEATPPEATAPWTTAEPPASDVSVPPPPPPPQ